MKRPLFFACMLLVACVHPAHSDAPQDCTEFRAFFEVFQRESAPYPERAALERMCPQ